MSAPDAGALQAQLLELHAQLADTEKERDDFCAMVVELETKLVQNGGGSGGGGGEDDEMKRRVAELERRNAALDADREALDARCASYQQQCEHHRAKAHALAEANRQLERDCEELRAKHEEAEQEKTAFVEEGRARNHGEVAQVVTYT